MHQLLIKLIERIILLAEKVDPSLKAEFDQIIVELENQQTAPQTSPATPATSPVPHPTPVPEPVPPVAPVPVFSFTKLFGVNMAGAEFAAGVYGGNKDGDLPGVEGTQYVYRRDEPGYKYFTDKGLKLFRIPFRWERMQLAVIDWSTNKQSKQPLSNQAVGGVMDMLDAVQAAGGVAIIEAHNYGRYSGMEIDSDIFADFWLQVATKFKNHPALYGYELMNEPQSLKDGADGWVASCAKAKAAIRTVDTSHYILIPGYDWQSAERWPTSNPNIHKLAGDKIAFAAHTYFDSDASGTYPNGQEPDGSDIVTTRIQPFLDWLKQHNVQGFLTEFGIPTSDPKWVPVLQSFLTKVDADPNIVGVTYWAAGPWWGDYPLSIEPNVGTDKPAMSTLSQFKTK